MSSLNLIPVFMVGLLGGLHCIGMCGGIVSAFSAASPSRRAFPVTVAVQGAGRVSAVRTAAGGLVFATAYNAGRIGSYMAAGALAGGLADGVHWLAGASVLQTGAYWLANVMLVAIGLYLMDAWKGLAYLESAGQGLWRRIQPLTRLILPAATPGRALILGALWGWLPCGMVYSVLATAMLSGSAASGAWVMLAFGLGTLPALLAAGMAGNEVRAWSQRREVRIAGGVTIAAFGILGILRAMHGVPHGWSSLFCVGAGA